MKKTILILGCCLLGWGTGLFAQQGTVSSGGVSSGTGGTATYSFGQIDYTEASGNGGAASQGVQQAYEIFTYGIGNVDGINLSASVYPNPTIETLTLKVEGNLSADLICQLYDEQGKLIMSKKVDGIQTSIDMSQLAIASYFLNVINNSKELKTFKIIKHK